VHQADGLRHALIVGAVSKGAESGKAAQVFVNWGEVRGKRGPGWYQTNPNLYTGRVGATDARKCRPGCGWVISAALPRPNW